MARWRPILSAFLGLALIASSLPAVDTPDFERDIAPLLVNHCLGCHQPNKHSGELNLSTLASILTGGDQGPALVAGKPAASLLIQRIEAGEMPPPDAKDVKPLAAAELELLRAWVAAGALWPKDRELGIHERTVDLDQARTFWSFQTVRGSPVPTIQNSESRIQNSVDCFIAAKLKGSGLSLAPPSSKPTLLRRISLDVRGLPPTLEEQASFLSDSSPDAYERLIDRFLSDPAHGERWARHWLDLVRYADSNGYERDGPKPSVWRYRDYVIAAFNNDKPYDRFVVEQLAGDELPEASDETLIATGFHALGAWQDEVDPLEAAQYRADELDDMIRTTAQTFLGLTVGCARCHNHKFDPLTMVDYYSLAAILAPLKRPNKGRTDRDVPLGTPDQIAAQVARYEELGKIQQQFLELMTNKPVDADKQRAALVERQRILRAEAAGVPAAYRCYEDSHEVPPTYLLISGRASNPGPLMQPQVPAVLTFSQPEFPAPAVRSSLRRLTLSRWIASSENPLTGRVIVNRVWQHHFGAGLAATPSDFGHMGARPTHSELLDWLAHWFTHDADWSLKRLHRQIMASATYRQASQNSELPAVDPENKLLWHFPYRRLDVETIRDSMLAAAGNLNRAMYGPAVNLPIPQVVVEAHTDKQAAWKVSQEPDINRRTVYAFVKRTLLVPLLETLDFCDTTNSTERRAITNVAPQALTLFNGDFVNRQAEVFAERLLREAGDDPVRQIDLAFRLALTRPPTAIELKSMQQFLADESVTSEQKKALLQLCRVILNLNEFVYPN